MKKIKPLPFFEQKNEYTCGPASLEMVLKFFGVIFSQKKLAQALHTRKDIGTKHSSIIQFARKHGFFVYVNNHSTLDEVKHFLHKQLCPIIHFTEPFYKEGHYAVVISIDKKQVHLNDPWYGADYKIPLKKFTTLWHASQEGEYFRRWLLVLSKEDLSFGKQFKPLMK